VVQEERPILEERSGTAAVLRLNRPERLNAVSAAMYERLLERIRELEGDDAVRCLVLIGTGRAFCVGADLQAHGSGEPTLAERRAYIRLGQRANRALQRSRKPVIAAVNGHAIGAGLEMALSSDLMVVAADAKLRFPELHLGTFIGGGTSYTLPQRVGTTRAKELLLLGEFFSGADAAGMGLANRSVPADEVLATALKLAERVGAAAPRSVALAKQVLGRASHLRASRTLREEGEALLACMQTADWREGIEAFREKRVPQFTGR
jgi:enoyl-CoA hydratase